MRLLFFTALFFMAPLLVAESMSGTIIDVERAPAWDASTTKEKDFFIDRGLKDGVQKGDVFEVFRWAIISDSYAATSDRLMRFKLGELRVLETGENSSWAKAEVRANPTDLPKHVMVEFMLGDTVEKKIAIANNP